MVIAEDDPRRNASTTGLASATEAILTLIAVINPFIELKKLKFGHTKCSQIHVGQNKSACNTLKVHEHEMKKSHKEKYLGDIISDKGDHKDNIDERVNKGYAIVNEIKASSNLENVDLAKYQACNGKWMELQMTGNILTTS